jgi:RNA polymerase sigma factor (sigma-70 family)
VDQVARASAFCDENGTELDLLVTAATDGDEQAWTTLVRRYTPLLANTLRRYPLDEADGADVVQVTWLRLVEHLSGIREPRALVGWLLTTARREAHRLLRQSGRVVPVDELDEAGQSTGVGSIEDEVERRDQDRQVRLAVSRLPASDRDLLGALLASPPPSYRAVAAALGRPVGSIGPTRARCLTRLRRELNALEHDRGRLAAAPA